MSTNMPESQRHGSLINILFALLAIMSLSLISCDSNDPRFATLTGTVQLINDTGNPANDPVDFSGVTITLFEAVPLDSTLVRINTEYPQIGVQISQETEFDHRGQLPVKSVVTKADGYYSISKVPGGTYNLVFEKAGWGFVYLYNVGAAKDDGTRSGHRKITDPGNTEDSPKTEIADVVLYPEVELPTVIIDSFSFKPGHHYFAANDTDFTAACSFEGGSYVHIKPGKRIRFLSTVITDSNSDLTRFDIDLEAGDQGYTQKWDSIHLLADNVSVSNWSVNHANGGIAVYGDNSSLTNSLISNSNNGVYAQGQNIDMSNLLYRDLSDRAIVLNQSTGSGTLKYFAAASVFLRCEYGVRTQGQAIGITNNYFNRCKNGVVSFSGYHTIQHNNFDMNVNAIVCNGSTIEISKNKFYHNTNSILFSRAYYSSWSNPRIKNNNFYQTSGYAINLNDVTTQNDIDASLNYWKSTDIDALIKDFYDLPALVHVVVYQPKLNNPDTQAGIIQ